MKTWQKLRGNPALWNNYFLREKTIKDIRLFFDQQKFHEVETSIISAHPAAESYVDVFTTILLDRKKNQTPVYLSTSPEVQLKKLLVAGIGNCYAITKSFRNGEVGDALHTPEFTILEWYRVGATYVDIMKDCEELFLSLCHISHIHHTRPILSYQNKLIDLTPPWPRLSMIEAFKFYANIDLEEFFTLKRARDICIKKGYVVNPKNTWEELFNQVVLNEIEPALDPTRPTILYDFPADIAALAKKKQSDPRFAERFEVYIGGLEIGDCYTELTDWKEQEERFQKELLEIKRLEKTTYDYDHDFIEALKTGLPACAGVAIGVDRIVMLLADTTNIKNTMFFPIEELL